MRLWKLHLSALLLLVSNRVWAAPIKIQPIQVTASSTAFGSSPDNVADGNPSTVWNSGSSASQWIQLDLGRTTAVRTIQLQAGSDTTSPHTITVQVGADPNNLRTIYSGNRPTADGQVFSFGSETTTSDRMGGVRYLRITAAFAAWREIQVYQGIEYFGFYGDHAGADFTTETTANGANLNYIDFSSAADLSARLAKVPVGNKAIVATNVLFDDTGVLRPDWQSQWNAMSNAIKAGGFQSTVAAFWLYEEPYWRTRNNPNVTKIQMRDWLTAIRNQIKSDTDFASTPLALLISVPELIGTDFSLDGSYVAMADWVGFDSYDTWYQGHAVPEAPEVSKTTTCVSSGATGGMCALINTLRSWLSPGQRMMAFPACALNLSPNFSGTSASVQYLMIDTNINMWEREALSDSKYVAVIPFLWDSELNFVGARDAPIIKKQMAQMAYGLIPRGMSHVFPISYSASATWGATAPAPAQPPTASSYSEWSPAAAFDLDASTSWNSGGWPAQWIQGNLAGSTRVRRIDLTTNQTPSGDTLTGLWGLTPNGWVWLATFQGPTVDSQTLTWTGSVDISAVQVETDQGPSWVGWRDIQIYQ
jgi:hypothetical protein